jgi:hypothetical protein
MLYLNTTTRLPQSRIDIETLLPRHFAAHILWKQILSTKIALPRTHAFGRGKTVVRSTCAISKSSSLAFSVPIEAEQYHSAANMIPCAPTKPGHCCNGRLMESATRAANAERSGLDLFSDHEEDKEPPFT